ncbi:helix-turn-helix domain-containing protein [Megasphaera hexanoica]|nr:helix-turn-helix domain-containing protein [Megasphaera hexanoica]
MNKAYRYRLYPTAEQKNYVCQDFRLCPIHL